MLSEINQTEKGKYYMISHVESKIKQNTKILDTENRSVIARGKGLKGGEMGEGSQNVKSKKKCSWSTATTEILNHIQNAKSFLYMFVFLKYKKYRPQELVFIKQNNLWEYKFMC